MGVQWPLNLICIGLFTKYKCMQMYVCKLNRNPREILPPLLQMTEFSDIRGLVLMLLPKVSTHHCPDYGRIEGCAQHRKMILLCMEKIWRNMTGI